MHHIFDPIRPQKTGQTASENHPLKPRFLLTSALVSASLAGTTPAFADLSPTDALERYLDMAEAMGSDLTVEEKTQDGETIIWRGITTTDPKTGSTATLESLTASPVDDNTVRIDLGPSIIANILDEAGDMPPFRFDIALVDNQVTLSEDGARLNASYSGKSMTMSSSSDTQDIPLKLNMSAMDMFGTYAFEGNTRVDGSFTSGPMDIIYAIADDEMNLLSNSKIASTEMSFGTDLPEDGEMAAFVDGDKNGSFTYTFKDIATKTSFAEDGVPAASIESNAALAAGTMTIQDGAFALLGDANDLSYTVQPPIPGMPPMSASMASATANMTMTAGEAGETAPMAIAFTLNELVLDDAVWNMFDPTGAIPRDPATLRLDLGADLTWMVDDFEDAAQNGAPPFIPESMELRELFLTLGGATISASGQGTMSMATGVPSGTATIDLKGVTTLITTLSQIGLVPVPQAMMAQGMLPQFTRPGPDGGDHMISDIEAKPDGSIYVNGTRIK